MDLGGSAPEERGLADYNQQPRDGDSDTTKTIRRKGDVGSPRNCEPISPEPDVGESEADNNTHTQLQEGSGVLELFEFLLPNNGI